MSNLLLGIATVLVASSVFASDCQELEAREARCSSELSMERQENANKRSEYSRLSDMLANPGRTREIVRQCRQDVRALENELGWLEDDKMSLDRKYERVSRRNNRISRKLHQLERRLFMQWECLMVDVRHAGNGVGFGHTEQQARASAKANVHKDTLAKLRRKLSKAAPADKARINADIVRVEGYKREIVRTMRKKGKNVICFKANRNHNNPLTEEMIVKGP